MCVAVVCVCVCLLVCVDGINSLFGQEVIMLTLFNEMRFHTLHSCILWSPDTRPTHSFKFTPPSPPHPNQSTERISIAQRDVKTKPKSAHQPHSKHQIKCENYLYAACTRCIQVTHCSFLCIIHITTNLFSRFGPCEHLKHMYLCACVWMAAKRATIANDFARFCIELRNVFVVDDRRPVENQKASP